MQTQTEMLPARGKDAIDILVNDHDTIKALLERLIGATKKTERKHVVEQLKGSLAVHNATEESIVYPALNRLAHKRGEADHLYHETAEADVALFELDSLLKEGDDEAFVTKAKAFRDAVLNHIDNEEKSAFPHLRDNVDTAQARDLTKSVRTFRGAINFES
jgi:hemerythrin superfamily protein